MFRLLLLAIFSLLIISKTSYALESWLKDPDGLREIKWGTPLDKVKYVSNSLQSTSDNGGKSLNYHINALNYNKYPEYSNVEIGKIQYTVEELKFDADKKFIGFSLKRNGNFSEQNTFNALAEIYGPPKNVIPIDKFEEYFKFAVWNLQRTTVFLKKDGIINFYVAAPSQIISINYKNNNSMLDISSDGSLIEITNNTDNFIKITSMSIYYANSPKTNIKTINFDKSNSKYREIPPLATVKVPVNTNMTPAEWDTYSLTLLKTPLKYGVVIEYTVDNMVYMLFNLSDF